MNTGIERIAAERDRQVNDEDYSPAHDAAHKNGALAYAAAVYAAPGPIRIVETRDGSVQWWEPWPHNWRRPSCDRIRELEKAGALIAAEIDRLLAGSEAS